MLAEGALVTRKRNDIFSATTRGSEELQKLKTVCSFSYDHKYRCGKEKRIEAHFIRFKVLQLEGNIVGK